ncbi:uncharacterized protein gogo isoform X2 [Venturia canescens]|uniref:uncharacterized protein gogo isoform X2 n=1 Tax=Venturia canescens TaxID=32260 RepID=UPI001C9D359F|nr:uncharacterized protein LOC122414405 isoform X2 [Venturia canescens]
MNWSSRWSPLRVLIFIFLKCGTIGSTMAMENNLFSRLIVAASHTALSGDLAVLILELPASQERGTKTSTHQPPATSTNPPNTITTTSAISSSTITDDIDFSMDDDDDNENLSTNGEHSQPDALVLRVMHLDGFTSEFVGEVPITRSTNFTGNISLTVPCGFFSRGGVYSLQLQEKSTTTTNRFTDISDLSGVQMRTTLDVRWPTPSLTLEPQHFNTYPGQPVLATLEYTGISCAPVKGIPVTTYSLQLIYCGSSVLSCDPRNKSHVQMLYSEEVLGFPEQRILSLRCEFFGLAGHYALRLKPSSANSSAPTTSAYIKVEWSDQYVFNVHARSVYPCDGGSGGLSVLFEYPACRLQGDRVRVYGRLRADVASLAPPSTLNYVAELKAPPGKHSLTFDCDIFTEKFVEYCFVYVSQAITNAMAEVRVDCIPTFPIKESDAGGWGHWSQWTPCSSSCVGGVRSRYRLCDTPPPRYGAKFCQGKAVETEPCGGAGEFDLHGNWKPGDWECSHGKGIAAERPEVTAEIGTKCRCGCLVNLGNETSRRIVAASTQACPGRSFWLVQAQPDSVVRLHLDQTRFPCPGQYVRARDGDSLSAELLADISCDKSAPESGTIVSTESNLLLEFFSDEITAAGESCIGGFLAHASTLPKSSLENGTDPSTILINPEVVAAAGRWAMWLSPAHLAAASLLLLMFLVSVVLALQYAVKYRKYQIAEDLDSLTDNSACSGSMQGLARRARAMSSSTLISEVVSLVRLPRRGSPRHARLEQTPNDLEDGYESTETQTEVEDENTADSGTLKQKDHDEHGSQRTIVGSSNLSTPSKRSSGSASSTSGHPEIKFARPVKLRTVGPITPVSEEASMSEESRRFSTTSASNSVNNGFSPASTSSNLSVVRCGKETKDRRNRERLLQGPGSEFSLANPDMDLELDYYDYNVVNAAAAPGSYLGMDPAFLVWIPPLAPGESEILGAIEEDHHYEEIGEERRERRDGAARLDTEGAALTPAEYQKIRGAKLQDGSKTDGEEQGTRDDEILPRRLDPGESKLHDEIIMEYRARLNEGMLPIHRLLEESRVRVSEESLSRHTNDETSSDPIPNRLVRDNNCELQREGSRTETRFTPRITRNRLIEEQERCRSASLPRNSNNDDSTSPEGSFCSGKSHYSPSHANSDRRTAASVRSRLQENTDSTCSTPKNTTRRNNKVTETSKNSRDSPPTPRTANIVQTRKHSQDSPKSRSRLHNTTTNREVSSEIKEEQNNTRKNDLAKAKTPVLQRKYDDITDFNALVESNKMLNVENIPMKELTRSRNESPVKVHRSKDPKKDVFPAKEIQSPDYGVEADIRDTSRESFYDFIGEDEDGFKFADDDEDEYIDNKIGA